MKRKSKNKTNKKIDIQPFLNQAIKREDVITKPKK